MVLALKVYFTQHKDKHSLFLNLEKSNEDNEEVPKLALRHIAVTSPNISWRPLRNFSPDVLHGHPLLTLLQDNFIDGVT